MPSIFMENTAVEDVNTVAAIQCLLATRGASSVQVRYDQDRVEGIDFMLIVNDQRVPFSLPCRWQAVQRILQSRSRKVRPKDAEKLEQKARRVAWRQILRWVEAQLALIETGMVKTEEVFLPYIIVGRDETGKQMTMHEKVAEAKYFCLNGPAKSEGDE